MITCEKLTKCREGRKYVATEASRVALDGSRSAGEELQHHNHQDDQKRELRHRSRNGPEIQAKRRCKEQVQKDAEEPQD